MPVIHDKQLTMENESDRKTTTEGCRPRLVLRPLEPDDVALLYDLENDMELWTAGYTNVPYSRDVLRRYIEQGTFDIYRDRQMRLLAVNEDDEVVGVVDLFNYEPQHNRAELGLVILRPFRHKGYGQELVRRMMDYGRRVIHLHQIYAAVAVDNEASLRMFRSMGFRSTVTLREWLFDGEKYTDVILLQLFLKKVTEKFGSSEK